MVWYDAFYCFSQVRLFLNTVKPVRRLVKALLHNSSLTNRDLTLVMEIILSNKQKTLVEQSQGMKSKMRVILNQKHFCVKKQK
jgi:hypothetical protein